MVKYLEIGQIVNTFGVKGQVKVVPFTDDIKQFGKLKELYLEKNNQLQLVHIEQVSFHKNMVILKIKEIDTMEEAEKHKNCLLKIDRKNARKLPKDTYFIVDLIGLDVYTDEDNKLLGKVNDIYNNGSSDIYVVKDEMGKQILLPAINEVLKKIDLDNGKIIVHLIKGLVD